MPPAKKKCDYSYCFVPGCKNTTVSTPDKLFFPVPYGENRRKWCVAVGRDPNLLSEKSRRKCCQDHFRLEDDVSNLFVVQTLENAGIEDLPLKLKKGVLPHLALAQIPENSSAIECVTVEVERMEEIGNTSDPNLTFNLTSDPVQIPENPSVTECVTIERIEEMENTSHPIPENPSATECVTIERMEEMENTSHPVQIPENPSVTECVTIERIEEIENTSHPIPENPSATECVTIERTEEMENTSHPAQISLVEKPENPENALNHPREYTLKGTRRKRSKYVQVSLPLSTEHKETQTQTVEIASQTENSDESEPEKIMSQSSDQSWHPPSQSTNSQGSQTCEEELLDLELKSTFVNLYTALMERSPMRHLGIPKDKMGLIPVFMTYTKCRKIDIYLSLRKIRKNESFDDLAEIFGIAKSTVSNAVHRTIPQLAACLSNYIFWPSSSIIKSNLPAPFRINYANVESIIDCFEIFMMRPSDPVTQALVYSDYKHHHTMKYLVSITPDGFINFVSKGYGGRTSDVEIVKKCGYLEKLKSGMVVMADRGFKEIAPVLMTKNCSIARPPSVKQGVKLTKLEARVAKVVASLRINVERIIKRIKEFHLFYAPPFHHNLLKLADQSVLIGCALANIQGPIYH